MSTNTSMAQLATLKTRTKTPPGIVVRKRTTPAVASAAFWTRRKPRRRSRCSNHRVNVGRLCTAATTPAPPPPSAIAHTTITHAPTRCAMAAPTSSNRRIDIVAANPPANTAHSARGMGMSRRRYCPTNHPLAGAVPPGTRLVRPVAATAKATMVRRVRRAPPARSRDRCTSA